MSQGWNSTKAGDAHRERMARRSREQSQSVADIGELPAVIDPERREACRYDLRLFLVTYFPNSTGLKPFSEDHHRVIDRIQTCILLGGRFLNAVYRGFAKTTISENAALWAVLYGHRRFVAVFGADQPLAIGNIDSIKRELESNDLLLEDFPEACYPIRCLEGKPQRQHSQAYCGELTHIGWTADRIVIATIPGSPSSGAILCAHGLTGSIRGLKHKRPDGTQQRPDLILVDDPQTDESAHSALQVSKRIATIKKTILKLAGHNKTLAIVINATVICPDDAIEQLQREPAWQCERIKMVRKWANAHETLWLKDYAELRNTYDKDDPESQKLAHRRATEFYREHRVEMDLGCVVSWEHCYDPEQELSAIQHAYNALIDDGPDVFASEYQNEPLPPVGSEVILTADEIARKVNGYAWQKVPQDAQHLTAFIDVQLDALYWLVTAWSRDFTGYVLDYGVYPEQRVDYFHLRDIRKRIADVHKNMGFEGALRAALTTLTDDLLSKEWVRDDNTRFVIERCLVDANWGDSTDLIYLFCRQSDYASVLMPSHGKYIGASSLPLNDGKPKPGELRGLHWKVPPLSPGKLTRHVTFDANYWKSFSHKRFAVAVGDKGCLSLYKASPAKHRMFGEHMTAESRVQTIGRGRKVDEWKERPGRPDNHLFDCMVGACVAASMQGVSIDVQRQPQHKKKHRSRERAAVYF